MTEISDTFVEPAIYCRYDKTLSAFLQYRIVITPDPCIKNQYNQIFSLLTVKINSDGSTETKFVYDISRTREKAFNIMRLLAENTVTPICILDVLEDLL